MVKMGEDRSPRGKQGAHNKKGAFLFSLSSGIDCTGYLSPKIDVSHNFPGHFYSLLLLLRRRRRRRYPFLRQIEEMGQLSGSPPHFAHFPMKEVK